MARTTTTAEAAPSRRARGRAISSVNNKATTVAPKLATQITDTFIANNEQNKTKKDYDAKRKTLLGMMQAEGRSEVQVTAKIPDDKGGLKDVALTATVATPETQEVDVEALLKIVPMDAKLIALLKATNGDIERVYGKATLARVQKSKTGEINVSVKPTK